MAICPFCAQEMSNGVSCISVPVERDGKPIAGPIRYGDEPVIMFEGKELDWGAKEGRPCHDCKTPPGGFHHPGCDVERCPTCKGQAISCACNYSDEE